MLISFNSLSDTCLMIKCHKHTGRLVFSVTHKEKVLVAAIKKIFSLNYTQDFSDRDSQI